MHLYSYWSWRRRLDLIDQWSQEQVQLLLSLCYLNLLHHNYRYYSWLWWFLSNCQIREALRHFLINRRNYHILRHHWKSERVENKQKYQRSHRGSSIFNHFDNSSLFRLKTSWNSWKTLKIHWEGGIKRDQLTKMTLMRLLNSIWLLKLLA